MDTSQDLRWADRPSDIEAAIVERISKGELRLPPHPAVARRIAALLRNKDYSIEDLLKLIASDQSLSANVLRIASARGSPTVSSVRAAVAQIGVREVSALALTAALGAQPPTAGPLTALKRRIWQDSLTSALLCQKLASFRGQSGEDAYTCGLLHDLGRLVTVTTLEQILETQPASQARPLEHWSALVDKFHLELGLIVATRWKLSRLLLDVITLHHGDFVAACECPDILDAVMACDQVVALANGASAVTASDLAQVPRLRSAAERDLIALALPACQQLVASSEARETATATEPSAEHFTPLGLDAIDVAHPAIRYRATGISASALILEGSIPLELNHLVQVSLQLPNHPFTLWMNPQSCEASEGSQRIQLKPFAFNDDVQRIWSALRRGLAEATLSFAR